MFYRIHQPRLALLFALAGALSFWSPDVALHVFAGREFDSRHVLVISFLMRATFLFAYLVARRFAVKSDFKPVSAAMLIGVWLTSGFFMTLAATASGGGFAGPDGLRGGLLMSLIALFPPVTFTLATYDGSAFALLVMTAGALLLWGGLLLVRRLPLHSRRG